MEKVKAFSSSDVYLASALTLFLGKPPQFTAANGKIIFVFDADHALYEALDLFNTGAPLNAYLLTQTIRRLRGEMILRKKMEVSNE